jgi:hypothetical protein
MTTSRSRIWWGSLGSILVVVPLVLAGACGDDGDTSSAGVGGGGGEEWSSSSSGTGGTGGGSAARLSGLLRYESVGYDQAGDGLDYALISTKPIRGARVALLDATNDSLLAETISDATGGYKFDWEGPSNVKIWVYAETTVPQIVVEDNTSGNAVYVLESATTTAEVKAGAKLDVLAGTGWTGDSYGNPRLAAPFAILDAAFLSAGRFLAETTPKPVFPTLKINWSIDNRPDSGEVSQGQIETSHWDGDEIYVLGKENIDTDEFDTHVIVHEWGHSFEQFISRSDSPGGSHGFGDVLEPRIAFSEGFCTALSGIILDPDSVYSDSYGMGQQDGFWEDVEVNDTSDGAVPGWYSEASVQNIVYDAYDAKEEPFDGVALGLQGVYAVMVGEMKTTPGMTTIFTFLAGLKAKNAGVAESLDALAVHHASGTAFGIDPVMDHWGTGETHAGGVTGALPLYVDLQTGGSANVTLTGGIDPAMLGQNRFIRFLGSGSPMTVSSISTSDVDLYVYLRGVEVGSAASTSGDEVVSFNSLSGEEYVVNVQGWGEVAGPYSATIEVQP